MTQYISTGYDPRRWQRDSHVMLAGLRFVVQVIHRRAGKTVKSVNGLVDAALRFGRRDGRFGYVAPFLKQAKAVAWDYLRHYTGNIPSVRTLEGELAVILPNGSRISLYGADNADAMRGLYFDGLVIDEVAQMRAHVWGEILRPTLADRHGWCEFIGTPKGINLFYQLYMHALKPENKDWGSVVMTVYDTGVLDAKEIEAMRATMSDAQFRQELLCDFGAVADNILITVDMVTDSIRRRIPQEPDLIGLPKVLGVDVARFGDDASVIQKRWGHWAAPPKRLQGIDNMTLVGHVAREIDAWDPDATFIDGGRGEGVIDRLRQLGYSVIEVQFGAKATNAHYANKRTEMYDDLRAWIEAGGVLPDDADLRRDLSVLTYKYDALNRMMMERKEEVKKRGIPSTDSSDALVCTFAEPVVPRAMFAHVRARSGKVVSEYNPFDGLQAGA